MTQILYTIDYNYYDYSQCLLIKRKKKKNKQSKAVNFEINNLEVRL